MPGSFFGIGNAGAGGLADTWVNSNYNAGFAGDATALQALINQQCNDCATYVKSKSVGTSKTTAYGLCQTRLTNIYADKMNALQASQKDLLDAENNATKAASNYYANTFNAEAVTGMSSKTIGVFVMLIIFIIIVYILLT